MARSVAHWSERATEAEIDIWMSIEPLADRFRSAALVRVAREICSRIDDLIEAVDPLGWSLHELFTSVRSTLVRLLVYEQYTNAQLEGIELDLARRIYPGGCDPTKMEAYQDLTIVLLFRLWRTDNSLEREAVADPLARSVGEIFRESVQRKIDTDTRVVTDLDRAYLECTDRSRTIEHRIEALARFRRFIEN